MSKYRIVIRKFKDHSERYFVQWKFFTVLWVDVRDMKGYNTLAEAELCVVDLQSQDKTFQKVIKEFK